MLHVVKIPSHNEQYTWSILLISTSFCFHLPQAILVINIINIHNDFLSFTTYIMCDRIIYTWLKLNILIRRQTKILNIFKIENFTQLPHSSQSIREVKRLISSIKHSSLQFRRRIEVDQIVVSLMSFLVRRRTKVELHVSENSLNTLFFF